MAVLPRIMTTSVPETQGVYVRSQYLLSSCAQVQLGICNIPPIEPIP